MAKPTIKANPAINLIHDDLEKYLQFCVEYGYKFDERNLYDMRSYPFQQFAKAMNGKYAKDMWAEDARRLGILI